MIKDNYLNFVLDKLNKETNKDSKSKLYNALLGLCSEVGEVQNLYKKVIYQGHIFDKEQVLNECGDILFYLTLLLSLYNYSLDDAINSNIRKLTKRYKSSATTDESVNRTN